MLVKTGYETLFDSVYGHFLSVSLVSCQGAWRKGKTFQNHLPPGRARRCRSDTFKIESCVFMESVGAWIFCGNAVGSWVNLRVQYCWFSIYRISAVLTAIYMWLPTFSSLLLGLNILAFTRYLSMILSISFGLAGIISIVFETSREIKTPSHLAASGT